MKRYLVFASSPYCYSPQVGWRSLREAYADLEEAETAASAWAEELGHWAHVVDTETMEIVYER